MTKEELEIQIALGTVSTEELMDIAADTEVQEIIVMLGEHKYMCIRWMTAINDNIPIELLKKLSKDKKYHVREGVALNKNTPSDILKKLLKDDCGRIYSYARRQLEQRGEF